MKSFSFSTPLGTLAEQHDTVLLSGERIALPGVISAEPILRGCDQKAWLERLVEAGIRHVVVPLNGSDEDTCLFARRHPSEDEGIGAKVLYDLERRDEGIFARLQFLIETAQRVGVMVGFSLFPLDTQDGPLSADANAQGVGLSLSAATFNITPKTMRRTTAMLRKPPTTVERIEAVLAPAVNWLAAELRGRRGTWVELFRGADMTALPPLHRELLHVLTVRLARGLYRSAKDAATPERGPWLIPPAGLESTVAALELFTPFSVWHGPAGEHPRGLLPGSPAPVCILRQSAKSALSAKTGPAAREEFRGQLWRNVFNGAWPLIETQVFEPSPGVVLEDIARVCRFALQWTGAMPLRPCPEIFDGSLAKRWSAGKAAAACDGNGRYFLHFIGAMSDGLVLDLIPGEYRYFWFDAATGDGLSRGDGVCGGRTTHLPGLAGVDESILVLEIEQIPDPFQSW